MRSESSTVQILTIGQELRITLHAWWKYCEYRPVTPFVFLCVHIGLITSAAPAWGNCRSRHPTCTSENGRNTLHASREHSGGRHRWRVPKSRRGRIAAAGAMSLLAMAL